MFVYLTLASSKAWLKNLREKTASHHIKRIGRRKILSKYGSKIKRIKDKRVFGGSSLAPDFYLVLECSEVKLITVTIRFHQCRLVVL